MKKVININFQGRVIPIEDSAYDLLQQYIASLRTYFANEEGRDEIINDIESRIGELFEEQLKKGASCITDEHVTAVMNSMGRPADFEKADEADASTTGTNTSNSSSSTAAPSYESGAGNVKSRRLYRDEQDKILGGVASGVAHYFQIDPAIVRILWILFVFAGGAGILLYVVLWIALPSRSLVNNIRKRLYRDTDDRIFKGVCGGLAKYFDINPIIPRIIFAAPFIFGLITTLGHNFFFYGPVFIGGFSGGSFLIAYIILWIVIPEAVTASEKLEMRGEKVDLNSIRNTIVEDMQGFKGRAEKVKNEVKETTTRTMKNVQTAWEAQGRPFVNEAAGTIRRRTGGLGNAIGVLLKAFLMIVGGTIAFLLLVALIFLLSTGIGRLQFFDFLLNGVWQKLMGLAVLVLFVGVPILAIAIAIIRRMMRVKSRSRYLSYTFSALWTIGLICLIFLLAFVFRDFHYAEKSVENITLVQPAEKLTVRLADNSSEPVFDDEWYNWNGAVFIENDSLYLNTVNINVIRSLDSQYHVHVVKLGNGANRNAAQQRTNKIDFPIVQTGDVLLLPASFAVGVQDKWRNQRVLVVIEVPVGKKINMSSDLNFYEYFNVYSSPRNRTLDRRWYDDQQWDSDEDMIQTRNNLRRTGDTQNEDSEDNRDENEQNTNDNNDRNAPHNTPVPMKPAPADTTRRSTDTTYRYPASTTQVIFAPQKKAKHAYSTLALSPLASIFW